MSNEPSETTKAAETAYERAGSGRWVAYMRRDQPNAPTHEVEHHSYVKACRHVFAEVKHMHERPALFTPLREDSNLMLNVEAMENAIPHAWEYTAFDYVFGVRLNS